MRHAHPRPPSPSQTELSESASRHAAHLASSEALMEAKDAEVLQLVRRNALLQVGQPAQRVTGRPACVDSQRWKVAAASVQHAVVRHCNSCQDSRTYYFNRHSATYAVTDMCMRGYKYRYTLGNLCKQLCW